MMMKVTALRQTAATGVLAHGTQTCRMQGRCEINLTQRRPAVLASGLRDPSFPPGASLELGWRTPLVSGVDAYGWPSRAFFLMASWRRMDLGSQLKVILQGLH